MQKKKRRGDVRPRRSTKSNRGFRRLLLALIELLRRILLAVLLLALIARGLVAGVAGAALVGTIAVLLLLLGIRLILTIALLLRLLIWIVGIVRVRTLLLIAWTLVAAWIAFVAHRKLLVSEVAADNQRLQSRTVLIGEFRPFRPASAVEHETRAAISARPPLLLSTSKSARLNSHDPAGVRVGYTRWRGHAQTSRWSSLGDPPALGPSAPGGAETSRRDDLRSG